MVAKSRPPRLQEPRSYGRGFRGHSLLGHCYSIPKEGIVSAGKTILFLLSIRFDYTVFWVFQYNIFPLQFDYAGD
jgi:hypothetical protein